ncbi:MAG: hypothetical protein D6713_09870 [Deltaproteobacteria bacterium]|nr:MAG: hypothetical protein D6713_09870 [Deltaproteobacteria bacterium]
MGSPDGSRGERRGRVCRQTPPDGGGRGVKWTAVKFFESLPLPLLSFVFEPLGGLVGRLDKRHRQIALKNLSIAFPDLEEGEKRRIVSRMYRHLGLTVAEIIKLGTKEGDRLVDEVEFEGLENILGAWEKGRGVFAVTGHFGNWELMAYAFGKRVKPIDVVVRPQKDTFLNEYINMKRKLGGNRVIVKFDAAREIIRSLREGRIIGVLLDQDTHRNRGQFVDFFGLKACTLDAIPRISYLTGSPMVPVFAFREGKLRHRVRFYEPLDPPREEKETFVRLSLERMNRMFEKVISERPDQWLWVHRRWRTRPEGEEDIYDF